MRQIPLLSICVTCRDNRESIYEHRGGVPLARKINKNIGAKKLVSLRGIKCMSNCNRACVLTLASDDGFTYMFGDIDPNKPEYLKSLIDLILIYKSKPDGFLHRRERPDLFRSNIVGRFPPKNSLSSTVTKIY